MFAIGDILKSGVRNFPDKEAIVFEDVRLTFREFNDRVHRLAGVLDKQLVQACFYATKFFSVNHDFLGRALHSS